MNTTSLAVGITENISLIRIRQAFWLYIVLLVFEGALRKWVLPGLATPLLIIRDPVAFYIIVKGFQAGIVRFNLYIGLSFLIAYLSFFTCMLWGHANPFVAIYGARPFLLHFPMIFVAAVSLRRSDVLNVGVFLIAISFAMVVLNALQFFSPQSSFVNRGVGGEGSAGFSGALGYQRPPGTFSFTNGNVLFFSLVASYIFYFWLRPERINRLLLILATIFLFVEIPLSISRTLMFQVVIVTIFLFVASGASTAGLLRGTTAILIFLLFFVLLSQFEFFQTFYTVMEARFTKATATEGGLEGTLIDRYLGAMASAFTGSDRYPFWGYGIGMGTQVGAKIATGTNGFLIAEGEWPRVIGELGIILGTMTIAVRVAVTLTVAIKSLKALTKKDVLPWMLLANAITTIPQSQWGQPTALGFSTVIGTLLLASLKGSR